MKTATKILRSTTLFTVALTFLFGIGLGIASASTSVVANSEIRVDLSVEEVSNLAGAQISLDYNDAVLEFTGIEEGSFLNESGSVSTYFDTVDTSTAGQVDDIILVRLNNSETAGNGTLVSLYFNVKKDGDAGINITEALLADNKAEPVSNSTVTPEVVVTKEGSTSSDNENENDTDDDIENSGIGGGTIEPRSENNFGRGGGGGILDSRSEMEDQDDNDDEDDEDESDEDDSTVAGANTEQVALSQIPYTGATETGSLILFTLLLLSIVGGASYKIFGHSGRRKVQAGIPSDCRG